MIKDPADERLIRHEHTGRGRAFDRRLGLQHAGIMFPLYVLLVNLPFGITIALAAKAMIGKNP